MRSRAKCKLCKSIIESKHVHDFVTCACGEISIDGGTDYFHASVQTDPGNLIAVDDEGNEIIPKYVRETAEEPFLQFVEASNDPSVLKDESGREVNASSRRELLAMLDAMSYRINSMPQEAQHSPISHSDFAALLSLIAELFRAS